MMNSRDGCRVALTLVLLLCGSGSRSLLRGQDTLTVTVQVTALFEESVYLDKGWVDGVSEGDVVRILVEPGKTIAASVRSVSSEDARCVPLEGIGDIRIGMLGQIDIDQPPSTGTPAPQDPRSPDPRSQTRRSQAKLAAMALLASIFSRRVSVQAPSRGGRHALLQPREAAST